MLVQACDGVNALWGVTCGEDEVEGFCRWAGREKFIDEAATDGEPQAAEGGGGFSVLEHGFVLSGIRYVMTYLLAPVTSVYKHSVPLPSCILQLSEFVDRLNFWLKTNRAEGKAIASGVSI
jgi:hypothetical protein